jgi:hypothetical protein
MYVLMCRQQNARESLARITGDATSGDVVNWKYFATSLNKQTNKETP